MLELLNTLNNSKYFTGIMMILLNIGSRFVEIKLSPSMESYVKYNIGKELLIFTMAWMGTRDIVVALTLTAVFVILSEFILNSNSKFCMLPNKFKKRLIVDTDDNGLINDIEINKAIEILEKARKQKVKERHLDLLSHYQLLSVNNN